MLVVLFVVVERLGVEMTVGVVNALVDGVLTTGVLGAVGGVGTCNTNLSYVSSSSFLPYSSKITKVFNESLILRAQFRQ